MMPDHASGSTEARVMKSLLKMENALPVTLYGTGDWEQLDTTDNLIDYLNHYCINPNLHNSLKTSFWYGKYIIIFNDTSNNLFPIHKNITSKDWMDIKDKPIPPVGPDSALNTIGSILKNIVKCGEDKKDLDDMKKLVINIVSLPDDVKLIYFQWQNKERITKSNIKKFQNDLTIKPGDPTNTQLELNFIRWHAGKLNFLIYKDSSIFCNVIETIKDQCNNFCKSLMAIKVWNLQEFYKLYCNIEEQCLRNCLWVLPYNCHSIDYINSHGFVCDNESADNNSNLPIECQNYISTWSITIYNTLNYENILPDALNKLQWMQIHFSLLSLYLISSQLSHQSSHIIVDVSKTRENVIWWVCSGCWSPL